MARRCIPSLVVVILMTLSAAVMAHRAPGSLSTIEWNENTQRTEIIHRLHTHDAETGVSTSLGKTGLSVLKIEDRARIALYVEEHFRIRGSDEILELVLVGAEIAGDYLLVYQEYPGRLPREISIRDSILLDVFKRQINQVNIQDGDAIHSLMFSRDADWLSYSFTNRDR